MTKRLSVVFSAVALVPAVSAPLAAQSTRLTANIPFEFKVDGKVLPAGEYAIQNGGGIGQVVTITNFETKAGALVITQRSENAAGHAVKLTLTATGTATSCPGFGTESQAPTTYCL
jgi:hypothetical protein